MASQYISAFRYKSTSDLQLGIFVPIRGLTSVVTHPTAAKGPAESQGRLGQDRMEVILLVLCARIYRYKLLVILARFLILFLVSCQFSFILSHNIQRNTAVLSTNIQVT